MVLKLKLCRRPVVVIQHSTESLSFPYGAVCRDRCFRPCGQPVVESLMVPLQMVMDDEFPDCFSQRVLNKQNHLF